MTGATAARSAVRWGMVGVRRLGRQGWLRVLGPAWIVMLADVDAPSVLTAAQAGTQFGYALLLPVVLLIPILYLVQEMTARLGVVTGRGHAELLRERYGVGWAGVAVVSMAAINLLAYVAEFAGIVLGAAILGLPAWLAVGLTLLFHSLMVLTGSYRRYERLAVLLSVALFTFVVLALTVHPDPGAVLGGLSFAQPLGSRPYLDLVVATVGAVIMPWMIFYQQAATVDKGLRVDDLRAARTETLVGAIASEVLMAAVVVAAAAAMTGPALGLGANVGALPVGLARLATGGTGVLIAVGMVGAGLLAAVVISLSSAWAWSELFHWPHSLNLTPRRAPGFYAFYLLEIVPAALIALWARNLVTVVIDAMILNVVVLAIPLAFLVRMAGDRTILGDLANGPLRSALCWAVTAGLLAMGLWSVLGTFGVVR
ncbi:MAG TPA: NRAMP family divalent metal transporter [Candidatus Acidoferrales bacterium]|nr:NRAMP family divalent metal transporter [Candidatus Acidoferrales bacterium]